MSGVAENAVLRRGRESLPSWTLMLRLISCRHSTRKTREGGCSFERAVFVLTRGLSHYFEITVPGEIHTHQSLERLQNFSNVFTFVQDIDLRKNNFDISRP